MATADGVALPQDAQPVARMVALDDGLGTVILEFVGERPPAGTVLYACGVPVAPALREITLEMMDEAARKVGFDPVPGKLTRLAGVLTAMLAAGVAGADAGRRAEGPSE